jgi:hypothetical protein
MAVELVIWEMEGAGVVVMAAAAVAYWQLDEWRESWLKGMELFGGDIRLSRSRGGIAISALNESSSSHRRELRSRVGSVMVRVC